MPYPIMPLAFFASLAVLELQPKDSTLRILILIDIVTSTISFYLVMVALRFSTSWFSFSFSADNCSKCSRADMTFCIRPVTCSGPWLSMSASNSFPKDREYHVMTDVGIRFLSCWGTMGYQYLPRCRTPRPPSAVSLLTSDVDERPPIRSRPRIRSTWSTCWSLRWISTDQTGQDDETLSLETKTGRLFKECTFLSY